jgi:hypothetical protein
VFWVISRNGRERAIVKRKRSLSVDRSKRRSAKLQEQSPFFCLPPAELRLKIYEMVLCETGKIHIRSLWRGSKLWVFYSLSHFGPEIVGQEHSYDEQEHANKLLGMVISCKRM